MFKKVGYLLVGLILSRCAGSAQTPIYISATPPAESPTPQVIVMTATEDPFAPTATNTPIPSATPTSRPRWEPIAIETFETAFRDEGYRRHPISDDDGDQGFIWVKENVYERIFTWEYGLVVFQVLHDPSPDVRSDHMELKFQVIDSVLPSGFMVELRRAYTTYNDSLQSGVTGEAEETYIVGGRFNIIEAEYNVREETIGGYRVRFSLWWRQATCPPTANYCYYGDFPGLEFTGDSSLIFQTIKLFPLEGNEIYAVEEQPVSVTQEPTPESVGVSWEFNSSSTEGWEAWNHLRALSVGGGVLSGESIGYDPYMGSPNTRISAEDYPYIEIRMKLVPTEDMTMERHAALYFIASGSMEYGPGKRKDFALYPGSEFHTYLLDMSTLATWKGDIRQIRFDPPSGRALFEIDFIRFLSKDLFQSEEVAYRARGEEPLPAHVGMSWEFNESRSFTDWSAFDVYSPVVYGGSLHFSCGQLWSLFVSPDISVEAKDYPQIEIRMRVFNITGSYPSFYNTARLYFLTNMDQEHDDVKMIEFELITDAAFHVYTFDMFNLPSWKAQITNLLLHPFDTSADLEIDYIRFMGKEKSGGGKDLDI